MIKQPKRTFDRRGRLDAYRKSLDRFGGSSTKLLVNIGKQGGGGHKKPREEDSNG
jgi:hypothetical protein